MSSVISRSGTSLNDGGMEIFDVVWGGGDLTPFESIDWGLSTHPACRLAFARDRQRLKKPLTATQLPDRPVCV